MTVSMSAVVRTTATITINGKTSTSVLHLGPRGADGTGSGGGGPIVAADITDASAAGQAVLTGTPAEGRGALELGDSATRAVGATAGTVAAGDDSRIVGALQATDTGLIALAEKVSGIAAGATANSTDAQLRDRSTHTGTQPVGTITGLGTAATADASAFATAAQGTDARDWTAETVEQDEAEAGTATDRRAWTALRVRQAIAAWWQSISSAVGRAVVTAADAAAARTAIGAQRDGYVGAVAVTGTPTAGQVPIASSGTAAAWGTPSSGGAYEVADWAALLALSGVPDGRAYTVLAPVITGGTRGTQWAADSDSPSGWRPRGRQVLAMMRTRFSGVTGGTTTEQLLWSQQVPAGVLAGCNAITLQSKLIAFGADPASRTGRWRLGTAGTIGDAAIGSAGLAGSAASMLLPQHLSVDSDTSVYPTHLTAFPQTPDSFMASGSGSSTVTVPSLTTSALYISLTIQQGASPASTVSAERAWIIVE